MDQTSMSLVADLTWDEVARRLKAGAFAILPIGAGAKQHGFHMPMRSDAIQAEYLAARLAETFPALIWPTVSYGYYPAFVDYAGSCSLSAYTFEAVVYELLNALLGYGARAVLLVDTGISTTAPNSRAIARTADPRRVLHLKVYDGSRHRVAAARLATQSHGTHADELETSLLLALAPALVRMDRAAASPVDPPGPGPMQRRDPSAPNFSASGSIGDPTSATAEKGRALLEAMVEDMIADIRSWASSTPATPCLPLRGGVRGGGRRFLD